MRHPAQPGAGRVPEGSGPVVVVGGGIAGIAAATGLAERGARVVLVEPEAQLGGRVRAWPLADGRTMSRGFHAFFRQYYNLRALLRRADPGLDRLAPISDYPLALADGPQDSFTGIPRTPPLNLAAFVAKSPSFGLRDLARVDAGAAMELLDVTFPATFSAYDGESAAHFLDRLRFPDAARHLALEVFARSFFAHPDDFAAGELVAMFHAYFLGSSEGLLFDVPVDDYETAVWGPLRLHLEGLGVEVRTETAVTAVDLGAPGDAGVVTVTTSAGESVEAAAVVVAADPASARDLLLAAGVDDPAWTARVADQRLAPPFAVWRLWLDRWADAARPPFLGTSGFGPLDNVSLLERFEDGARVWSERHGGSVVELHAYALPVDLDEAAVRARMRAELDRAYPELAGAVPLHDEWLVRRDCPLAAPTPWVDRLTVTTPDPRLVLAGDGVRCDLPVALMERAATTGFLAANALLARLGTRGQDLWSVPMQARNRLSPPLHRLLTRVG